MLKLDLPIVMPKTKRSNASGSPIVNVAAMEKINKDTLALSVLELLKDTAIVAELKETLFPIELKNSITNLTATVVSLTNELDRKEKRIVDLEKRVDFWRKQLTTWSSTRVGRIYAFTVSPRPTPWRTLTR